MVLLPNLTVTLREAFATFGWLSIVRAPDRRSGMASLTALLSAGVRFLEISATHPRLARPGQRGSRSTGHRRGGGHRAQPRGRRGRPVGRRDVRRLAQTDVNLIRSCVRAGLPILAGALSPTEVVAAWSAGAAAIKLFPASLGGPDYLRELRGPLPHIPLVPTGGVTADNAGEYLASGAIGVAVASWLTRDLDDVAARVARLRVACAPPSGTRTA